MKTRERHQPLNIMTLRSEITLRHEDIRQDIITKTAIQKHKISIQTTLFGIWEVRRMEEKKG